ncbi:MAG TPA: hypothetical protein PLQ93_08900 [Bacteroidia bacterium]|nr:hypothetical protein [Bacteroidia bacterium]
MKTILVLLFLLHALIHLIGTKRFRTFADQNTKPGAGRFISVLWLVAAILFGLSAVQLYFFNTKWWYAALAALPLSQLLISLHWKEARFGTALNILILLLIYVGYSGWKFENQFATDYQDLLKHSKQSDTSLLRESDLAELPGPVRKYIRQSGALGQARVHTFRLKLKGKIRRNENSEWMPLTCEQYSDLDQGKRLFFMKAKMMKLPVTGYHRYLNGEASMDIRLLSTLPVQHMNGEEMNVAETVTFFNDMCCMAPASLIDKRIAWHETDSNTVQATFTLNSIRIHAILYFNGAGELINFRSDERYSADAKKRLPWWTPLYDYKSFGQARLASRASLLYTYPEGEVKYGEFETLSVEYNVKFTE